MPILAPVDWLEWGYAGLFLACFLGASVVPFSSETVLVAMLLAGGDTTLALLFATTGNWLGGMSSYWIGTLGRWEWIEKWFRTPRQKVLSWQGRIERFGSLIAAFTWVPIAGDAAALALGFFRVHWLKAGLWMLLGRFARYLAVVAVVREVL